jgi:hypothetical protein
MIYRIGVPRNFQEGFSARQEACRAAAWVEVTRALRSGGVRGAAADQGVESEVGTGAAGVRAGTAGIESSSEGGSVAGAGARTGGGTDRPPRRLRPRNPPPPRQKRARGRVKDQNSTKSLG